MRGERDEQGYWDSHIPTTIYKIVTNKDLLYSTGTSEFSNDLLGKRTFKKVDICVV